MMENRGEVNGDESTPTTTVRINVEDASDIRRGAATRGTVTRGDTFPLAATEQLSERRGRESVSPHHTHRTTAAAAVVTLPPSLAPSNAARPHSALLALHEASRVGPCPRARAPPLAPNFKSVKDALSSRCYASPSSGRVNALRWNFRRARLSECRITARDRVILARPSSYRS